VCALAASVAAQPVPIGTDAAVDMVDRDLASSECQTETNRCTLRAAVQQANANPGQDEIVLAPITHRLDLDGDESTNDADATIGDLDVTEDLTITGQVTESAASIIDAGGISRIFHVHGATLTLKRVKLMNGDAQGETNPLGGAVLVGPTGAVSIVDSTLEANEAVRGAGIFASSGPPSDSPTVTLERTTVAQSIATGHGGGIVSQGRGLRIVDSIIRGNSAQSGGGVLVEEGGAVTLERSTVTGNKVIGGGGGGGGVQLTDVAQATIVNTTFSGNSSDLDGGAILVTNSSVTLQSVTVLKNTSILDGAGVRVRSGTLTLDHVLLARNGNKDCHGSVESLGYNLIETIPPGCTVAGDTSTDRKADALKIDEELKENSNPLKTLTHALLPKATGEKDNPAIDAGGTCPDQDQRRFARVVAPPCDIGAFEYFPDEDRDGVIDPDDNCPRNANPKQEDEDADDIGDVCDKCPTLSYTGFADDLDGVPTPDDCCPKDSVVPVDKHGCDLFQQCPCDKRNANCGFKPWKGHREWRKCIKRTIKSIARQECADQTTRRKREACRRQQRHDLWQTAKSYPYAPICGTPDKGEEDPDGDGTPDSVDNCPGHFNRCQANTDQEGRGDACDDDDDNDGLLDWDDNCPTVANPPASLGVDQADADLDGVGDPCDRCPDSDTELDPEDTNAQGCSVGETPGPIPTSTTTTRPPRPTTTTTTRPPTP
jgi:predicted outer membrane repeat protein